MSEHNRGLDFLAEKYKNPPLHASPEVKTVALRTKRETGKKVPDRPDERIQNYLDYLKDSVSEDNPHKREEKLARFKQVLYGKYVIKPGEIPEAYFDNQRRITREQGRGDKEITDEIRKQHAEVIIADQKSSMNNWIDYLSSSDATYPDWLKYWAIRSILEMGEYDKKTKSFTKRSKGTVKPFPDLDREALSYVLDAVEKKYAGQRERIYGPLEENDQQWEDLLAGENFGKLYAWAVEKVTPASKEQLVNTEGKWVKYDRGSDHMPLVKSLQGHGTGWCTAGEMTAKKQLTDGDFYVYYSFDTQNNPVNPRVAIRMDGQNIAEVRGIAIEQNLDPYIGQVVQDKLKEFPDGKLYEKKTGDMKQLTLIDNKIKAQQALTKEELRFLYEIESTIQGFGYGRDPRIQELRQTRDHQADALVIFDCNPEQIAWGLDQITNDTRVYVGPMFPGIFQKLKTVEHIYTTFPEGRIAKHSIEIGGETEEQLEQKMKTENIVVSKSAQYMMKSAEFVAQKQVEPIDLMHLKVSDLQIGKDNPTVDEIYAKAKELGLELCPAEVGPRYRLNYLDQPTDEYLHIGMKQITGADGGPYVFGLNRDSEGLCLDRHWLAAEDMVSPDTDFVFCLRR